MSLNPFRLLIADDHPVYRDGLVRLFDELPDVDVVGTAADGEQAVHLAESLSPDVIVMDLRMPQLDGIEATRQIVSLMPHIRVVVLTMFEDDDLVFAAVRAGARGYLLKDADEEQIAAVVRGIARGEVIFGPKTASKMLALMSQSGPDSPRREPFPQLTAREQDVLQLMARGRSNQQIAADLFLSERTVRNYVSNVLTKLQVHDRAQAIVAARDAGIGDATR